jgi:putative tricarboxylic transport membrane protein
VFWGFGSRRCTSQPDALALNLPLSAVRSSLRIPYAYLYPLIVMFCLSASTSEQLRSSEVWIMLIMGVVGYGLRRFGFDPRRSCSG